ncbi:MAG: hypothetical protein M5U14_04535 [Acidimicrobiia bacterium]|nr:hypothetical protein [Acidimicrobiia bacterium]
MNEYRWINHSQPQTLVIATVLLYLNAAFGLLFGVVATSRLTWLLAVVGMGVGGFGVANEKKWGYAVAVAASVLQVAMLFIVFPLDEVFGRYIFTLMFDGALVALLLHPMSRDYQRIWFR